MKLRLHRWNAIGRSVLEYSIAVKPPGQFFLGVDPSSFRSAAEQIQCKAERSGRLQGKIGIEPILPRSQRVSVGHPLHYAARDRPLVSERTNSCL